MKKQIIMSIVSGKGGVAKTSSSVNIASCLTKEKNSNGEFNKVLLIDLDKQSNTTKYVNRYNPNEKHVANILIDKIDPKEVIVSTDIENLHIVPASYVPLEDAPDKILLDVNRSRMNRLKPIQDLDYDFVIIDCPPSLGTITMNALAISDYVLVPIKVDPWGLEGFSKILEKMQIVREEYNPKLNLLGAFITLDEHTRVNNQIKESLVLELEEKFFNQTIRKSVRLIESAFSQVPLIEYYPNENITKDYVNLTKEILASLN